MPRASWCTRMPNALRVVIWGNSRSKFSVAPESAYHGENIAVTGQVTEYEGAAQIVINSPSAIETCGSR